jgi:hypothetical protein
MRNGALVVLFTSAVAAGSCASSLGSGPDAGPGGAGGAGGAGGVGGVGGAAGEGGYDAYPNGTICDAPLGDDCSPAPLQSAVADICTLNGGIGFACLPCGPDAGQNCGLQTALIRGAQYTYIEIFNVDAAFVYVYDQNQKLVAKLEWLAGLFAWRCLAGPAVFDSTEAKSLLPLAGLPGDASTNALQCSS